LDEQEFIRLFGTGTYDGGELTGKTFKVEILSGFVDLGFSGRWIKRFMGRSPRGYNRLGKWGFGYFRVESGVWRGYNCVVLDYGPGFVTIKDYIRQVDPTTWLGAYEISGVLKGFFRLKEVEK